MNKCIQKIELPEWMTKRKDHFDPERFLQRNRPKQLQNHNVPTDYVKNANGTN